jgi:hypothetical protein
MKKALRGSGELFSIVQTHTDEKFSAALALFHTICYNEPGGADAASAHNKGKDFEP